MCEVLTICNLVCEDEARGGLSLDSQGALSIALVLPLLILVMVLDLAIFGVFSDSPNSLNRVSRFFFHVRNGAAIKRQQWLRRRYYSRDRRHLDEEQRFLLRWVHSPPPKTQYCSSLLGKRKLNASPNVKGLHFCNFILCPRLLL